MFKQLPMYQKQGAVAYKADLSNTLMLASYLNHPELNFKSVHVAGTNGKGSTSHMLASILQEQGYKTGLYTSPHLKDFRERIKINGEMITESEVISFVERHKSFFEKNSLSFFEMTVGMAFEFFSKEKVDIAIIEVGMGGRLDSTNIIIPEVSVITNIGFDHMAFLGDTLGQIAGEKAGIIKNGVPVVIGKSQEETKEVFKAKALDHQSPIYFVDQSAEIEYESDLKGIYQKENKRTVLKTIQVLRKMGWAISDESLETGFKNVVRNTGLRGRWQILQKKPLVICDTAHNKDGLELVIKQLQEQEYEQLHMVLGAVNDKDLDSILPLFPKDAIYYFARPDVPRGLDEKELQKKAKKFHLNGMAFSSVSQAYLSAKQVATERDLIYVGGSTFVVAEII